MINRFLSVVAQLPELGLIKTFLSENMGLPFQGLTSVLRSKFRLSNPQGLGISIRLSRCIAPFIDATGER